MDAKPLGSSRSEIRVRLHGAAQCRLKVATVDRSSVPDDVKRLQYDRRALLELFADAVDLGDPTERSGTPRDVGAVVPLRQPNTVPD